MSEFPTLHNSKKLRLRWWNTLHTVIIFLITLIWFIMQKETFGSICMENEQLHGNYLQIYPVWQRYTVKTKRFIFKRAVLACVMNSQLQIIYSYTYVVHTCRQHCSYFIERHMRHLPSSGFHSVMHLCHICYNTSWLLLFKCFSKVLSYEICYLSALSNK